MSEYEMLLKYRDTKDSRILYEFFTMYEKLISKLYYKSFYSDFHMTLKDFKQECFLLLPAMMANIDLNKITDPEKWKLFSFYVGAIVFYRGLLFTKSRRDAMFHVISEDISELDILHYEMPNDLKLTSEYFIASLDKESAYLFKSRFLDNELQGKTIKEIAKSCNRSHSWVFNKLKAILVLFSDYIKEEPSKEI